MRVTPTCVAAWTVAAAIFAGTASADVWNKKTTVTFPETVELPGNVVVPPGDYVFKLADSMSNRHIVQVMNKDEDKVFATILAIPHQRDRPAEKTVMTFYETPRDRPMFIRTWFYPGDTIGQEFAYPKDRASYIASASNTNVPVASDDRSSVNTALTPRHQEVPVPQEPVAQQQSQPVEIARNTPPVAAAAEPSGGSARSSADEADQAESAAPPAAPAQDAALPTTASGMPLLVLSAAGLLAAAGVVRRKRR